MKEKRLEEIKVKGDKVRKSLAEEQKSIRERQEVLRKQILIMKALDVTRGQARCEVDML